MQKEIFYKGKLNNSQYLKKKATTILALVEKQLILESSKLTCKDSIWVLSVMSAYYDRHIK